MQLSPYLPLEEMLSGSPGLSRRVQLTLLAMPCMSTLSTLARALEPSAHRRNSRPYGPAPLLSLACLCTPMLTRRAIPKLLPVAVAMLQLSAWQSRLVELLNVEALTTVKATIVNIIAVITSTTLV